MSWWWSASLAVAALLLLATWMRHRYSHWARRGVKFVKPVPFFGNMLPALLQRSSFNEVFQKNYHELKPHKFGGTFGFLVPSLMVTDPDLIREVTVKSFDHFSDRRSVGNEKNDPLFFRALFGLKGAEWRHMRNRLSPAFTTSKLRGMFPLIARCGEQFARFLVTRPRGEPLEFKAAFTRLTNDVIATSRPDMLQLLMAAQKGGIERAHGDEQDAGTVGEDEHAAAIHKQHLASDKDSNFVITDDDMAAQAFVFFLAGFDTIAILLSFISHELAVNPDVQQRLREEIDAAILENDGKLTYDNVQKMKYLDMVVSEAMRKYPPGNFTDRKCTKNFKIPGTDVVIEKGTSLMIPFYALHRDPEYFPDPERFDPERFSEENKKNIKPYTYLPFGSGPHNCIGMRFALLEAKLCLCYLLATCELRVSAKTEVPLKLSKKTFQLSVDAGFWLACEPREEPAIKLDS